MSRRRIHVLYEYGPDLYPHGSAFVRLLRPLTHPSLHSSLEVSSSREVEGQSADVVIVDRLWRPDISTALARKLVQDVRHAGARMIYALDDNLLDLPPERFPLKALSTEEYRWIVQFFLHQADGVLVTSQALQQRISSLNRNTVILPHALDERLLVAGSIRPGQGPFGTRRKVVGYMGTPTHDDDLMMILPALQAVGERHREKIEFQFAGVIGRQESLQAMGGLPLRMVNPRPEEHAYSLFMLWFTSSIHWDIAISPLRDTVFNRCKSDIKFLDYSAIGAAGIYSKVPAYESSVHNMERGLLVENDVKSWTDALEAMLLDDRLRIQLAHNAAEYLYTERTLAHRAQDWLTALDSLLEHA
jgi:processive 1,2-diacylglycerol beta-glucosyltransferase